MELSLQDFPRCVAYPVVVVDRFDLLSLLSYIFGNKDGKMRTRLHLGLLPCKGEENLILVLPP